MEIKQLKTFLAVADARSFLKAADSLYVTRQAISKTIDQLEDELGIELFFRNQKGAMMTPAGIYFYPRAASVVAEFDKLKSETMEMKHSYRPKINVCMSIGIYEHYATEIYNYRVEHSNEMQVSLRCCLEADAATVLADRRADAILSFLPPSQSMADTVKVLDTKIVFLVSKESAAADREVGISQLPKLLYNGGTEKAIWWDEPSSKNDIISSDLSYLFSLLQNGYGVLPIPEISVPDYLNFTMTLPAYPPQKPRSIYYSTLQPDHYNALSYTLMDVMYQEVISAESHQ